MLLLFFLSFYNFTEYIDIFNFLWLASVEFRPIFKQLLKQRSTDVELRRNLSPDNTKYRQAVDALLHILTASR